MSTRHWDNLDAETKAKYTAIKNAAIADETIRQAQETALQTELEAVKGDPTRDIDPTALPTENPQIEAMWKVIADLQARVKALEGK